jgi:MFS family permease
MRLTRTATGEASVSVIAAARGADTFRSLQRHRNYRLYFAGQIVSLAGTWMQNVALTWLVLELSRSPIAVGALAFWRFVPYTLLGLGAGVIADRFDTRRVLMLSQAGAMALSVALAVVALTDAASLPLVYAIAALGGVMLVLEAPCRNALTFEMVGPDELPNAVALNSGLLNASRVIGPAVAGVVIGAAGVGACFAVNAVSFLAVLAALAAMRTAELHPVSKDPEARILAGTWEGLRYTLARPDLRRVLGVVGVIALFGLNFNTLVPLLASDQLHVGAEAFGALSAAFGAGALVGALASASLPTASWRLFATGSLGFSGIMVAIAWTDEPVVAGALLFLLGASFTLLTANGNALLQLGAPDRLRGRVVSLYLYAFIGLTPVGGLLAGWLTDVGGTRLAFSIAGLTGVAAIAVATLERIWPAR